MPQSPRPADSALVRRIVDALDPLVAAADKGQFSVSVYLPVRVTLTYADLRAVEGSYIGAGWWSAKASQRGSAVSLTVFR